MRNTTRKYKFLIKDKTELNHSKHELSLTCYSHFYIIIIIWTVRTMNSSLQGLLSALEKPKSNPVDQVSFYSDKVNENQTISEHDERRQ